MVELRGGVLGAGHGPVEFVEERDLRADVVQERGRQVMAEAVAHDDALHGHVGEVVRHRVGRASASPACAAGPTGRTGSSWWCAPSSDCQANTGMSEPSFHRSNGVHLSDLGGEILRDVEGVLLHAPEALVAQPQEQVVLQQHLGARSGEVEGERRHVAAEVAHVEDQLVR